MTEKFTFFWSGPLSQWHKCSFEIDGIIFNCAEQYMMWSKAVLHNDNDTAQRILMSKSPKTQKNLGRMVAYFDHELWKRTCEDIVKRGNLAKFGQNPALLETLKKSAGTTLVEASPYDNVWGIGLAEHDPRAKDRSTWRGRNLLGKVLTEVRMELCNE